ncbi:CotH kinase family protein [Candidatus Nitrosacidococcus sp. I8]|uniref:CotH kinase family protein n=1 Tax=Candidatus Nitrosacidococcus sp. I8 TaxID=2942908 RepID=UPI002227931C|nr:CotH kinase family protein [Candidatus Nitrosacidococcus sp. I8]CAH9017935.1 hypothetical protein NURINAE_00635 [Candidatus Nitrosacidococcus sp. I8]
MNSRIQALLLISIYSLFNIASLKADTTAQASLEKNPTTPNEVIFSQPSGFYKEDFTLTLSHPDNNITIYYTLDGSEPDPNNLKGSTYRYKNNYEQPPNKPKDNFLYHRYKTYQYSQPILIKDRTNEPDRISQISTTFDEKPDYFPQKNQGSNNTNRIIKGTPVRAIAVNEAGVKSPMITHTFFIGSQEEFHLPIIALTVPEKDLFGYDEGIFVVGRDYDEWLATEPEQLKPSRASSTPANWHRKDKVATRKNAAMEQLNLNQESPNLDVKISIHGNGSRMNRDKSFRIYLGRYQSLAHFVPNGSSLKELRFNFKVGKRKTNNFITFITDTAAQRIIAGLSFGTQNSYGYRNIFLNGEYYGIRNIQDVKDTRYIHHFYHLNHRKKIELLFNRSNNEIPNNEYHLPILKGSFQEWRKINQAFEQKENQNINFAQKYIDINSFIDYYIAEIYLANRDWLDNNYAFWKYSGKNRENNPIADGRYRWLIYDLDATFRESNTNSLEKTTDINDRQYLFTFIFSTLLKNPEFKERFITRFSDLMNTTFVPDRMVRVIENMKQEVEKDVLLHIKRWKSPISIEAWQDNINIMVNFARERPAIQYQQLQDFFKLDDTYQLKVAINDQAAGTVKVNTLQLGLKDNELTKPVAASSAAILMEQVLAFPWQGRYFKELPLKLEAIPKLGYQFSHWQGEGFTQEQAINPILALQPKSNIKLVAMFEKVNYVQ